MVKKKKKIHVTKAGLFLSLKLEGVGRPSILGLCHQTTGCSLVRTAVWMLDKTQ